MLTKNAPELCGGRGKSEKARENPGAWELILYHNNVRPHFVQPKKHIFSKSYSMPSSFWISSSGTPLVSGIMKMTQSSCRTIIKA